MGDYYLFFNIGDGLYIFCRLDSNLCKNVLFIIIVSHEQNNLPPWEKSYDKNLSELEIYINALKALI